MHTRSLPVSLPDESRFGTMTRGDPYGVGVVRRKITPVRSQSSMTPFVPWRVASFTG